MSLERITPEEALERMEDEGWVYVDVRSIPEFEGGHPEGAYNVPWKHRGAAGMSDNPDFLKVMEAAFGKDAKLILGCQAGGRSRSAAEALLAAGFSSVVDQLAGWGGAKDSFGQTVEPGWQAAGLPMALEPEEGRDYASLAERAGVDGS
ncbi:MAG TPA: rhodanese-like domain-containing protein [Polyangiaceae bacterium LLY-WYZ-15_(1-7)]|nr:rhodanese [Sandaracinus sp.]HJK91482.1 rhodanese-like domain-containing protein [Polyangiaceae bacterium LLY-WYZ-15_(1-7)]MBJ69905.1 rhodanese [Sandaracinus sp.]HJL02734.1 rhodanese-like domain-containing protein [Polyangiaceae bacterium LLY-WYZ-15_(1-7)]HJL07762.1 rhodanese-like domain-containing protein [Polyangiaceae bacterium LLY-WYZ-15_(1-7)]